MRRTTAPQARGSGPASRSDACGKRDEGGVMSKEQELEAAKNSAYQERDKCVSLIAHMALAMGFAVGLARHTGDPWEDDWRNIVFVELPTGQVSWHVHDSEMHMFCDLPRYTKPWDGHSTSEKYHRVLACSSYLPRPRAATETRAGPEEG
jgi:hypothetical protein